MNMSTAIRPSWSGSALSMGSRPMMCRTVFAMRRLPQDTAAALSKRSQRRFSMFARAAPSAREFEEGPEPAQKHADRVSGCKGKSGDTA